MGEVRDKVAGPAPAGQPAPAGNIKQQLRAIADEVSRLITIKDDDALTEGDAEKAANLAKAGALRAVFSLLQTSITILEGLYATPGS